MVFPDRSHTHRVTWRAKWPRLRVCDKGCDDPSGPVWYAINVQWSIAVLVVVGLVLLPWVKGTAAPTPAPTAFFVKFDKQELSPSSVSEPSAIFAIDIDGDADVDVLTSNNGDGDVHWWENDGTEQWTEHILSASLSGSAVVFAIDLDGDGDVDILAGSTHDNSVMWYENDGNQSFSASTAVNDLSEPIGLYCIDVDGDDDIDIITGNSDGGSVMWHEQTTTGEFSQHGIDTSLATKCSTDTSAGTTSVYGVDFDSDGDVDILATDYISNGVVWFRNDGSQSFDKVEIGCQDYPMSVVAADINGDGDLDAVVGSNDDSTVAWWENYDNAVFDQHAIKQNCAAQSVFAIDADADADIDVFAGCTSSSTWTLRFFENDGTGSFSQHNLDTGDTFGSVFSADVDGDGDTDVVGCQGSSNTVSWYKSEGVNTYPPSPAPSVSHQPTVAPSPAPVVDDDSTSDSLIRWNLTRALVAALVFIAGLLTCAAAAYMRNGKDKGEKCLHSLDAWTWLGFCLSLLDMATDYAFMLQAFRTRALFGFVSLLYLVVNVICIVVFLARHLWSKKVLKLLIEPLDSIAWGPVLVLALLDLSFIRLFPWCRSPTTENFDGFPTPRLFGVSTITAVVSGVANMAVQSAYLFITGKHKQAVAVSIGISVLQFAVVVAWKLLKLCLRFEKVAEEVVLVQKGTSDQFELDTACFADEDGEEVSDEEEKEDTSGGDSECSDKDEEEGHGSAVNIGNPVVNELLRNAAEKNTDLEHILKTLEILQNQVRSHNDVPLEYLTENEVNERIQEQVERLQVNPDDTEASAMLELLIRVAKMHPDIIRKEREKAARWESEQQALNQEALNVQRGFIPPNIFSCTATDLESMGMPPALVRRVQRVPCLWLVRMHPDDIARMHFADLKNRFDYAGHALDLTEMRAMFAALPQTFVADTNRRKETFRADLRSRIEAIVSATSSATTGDNEAQRQPCYHGLEPIFDVEGEESDPQRRSVEVGDPFMPRTSFHELGPSTQAHQVEHDFQSDLLPVSAAAPALAFAPTSPPPEQPQQPVEGNGARGGQGNVTLLSASTSRPGPAFLEELRLRRAS